MPELIDRLEAIQRIKNDFCSECDCEYGDASCKVCEYDFCIGILNEMPTIEAEPVRHGRWDDSNDGITPYCTVCGRTHRCFNRTPDFCPNCGADMREGGADNG